MSIDTLYALTAAFLGLFAGSFLNAVLFRYNTGHSALRGRSKCMHCSHTLSVLDLVPVFSYLFLKGKCRYCASRISWQYPLVELLGLCIGVGVYMVHGVSIEAGIAFVAWMVLLFLSVYDLRHFILPWGGLAMLLVAGAIHALLVGGTMALVAGCILALPFFLLSLVSRGRWMGWGDAPLALGIGFLVGIDGVLSTFVLSFWIGAPVGITLMWLSKRYTMKSELPFAPFLVAAAACVYFFHVDIFQTLGAIL